MSSVQRFVLIAVAIVTTFSAVSAQPASTTLSIAPKFLPIYDSARSLELEAGYKISVFAAGMFKRPRFMAIGPNNVLYVADMDAGAILAVRDTNGDGIADTAVVVTPHLDSVHSLAFYQGALYAAEPSRIRKFWDRDGDGFYETEEPFITGIGASGVYNHFTRTIVIDSIAKYIYVSVGASCNACREQDSERATILRFNLDGTGRTIYATGLRNAIGLAVSPYSGQLWASNPERDKLGDDAPSEIIGAVDSGAFYGWPFAYGDQVWDDFQAAPEYTAMLPITAADSVRVSHMGTMMYDLPAHSTPMAILFSRFAGTLLAVHGSSAGGRTVGLGYQMMRLGYDSIAEGYVAKNFLSGFLTDPVHYKYWGRPCGLVEDSSGNIYLSSDAGIPAIYKISLAASGDVRISTRSIRASIYPNPVREGMSVSLSLPSSGTVSIVVRDLVGRERARLLSILQQAEQHVQLPIENLTAGTYFLEIETNNDRELQKLVIE